MADRKCTCGHSEWAHDCGIGNTPCTDCDCTKFYAAVPAAPAPEATREADAPDGSKPLLQRAAAALVEAKRTGCSPCMAANDFERLINMAAEVAAQARENETLRADNQRLALRVKTLLGARATAARKQEALKAELEALPRWGMVSRGGEAPELDHSPRGGFVERSAVLRALAARAPEAQP